METPVQQPMPLLPKCAECNALRECAPGYACEAFMSPKRGRTYPNDENLAEICSEVGGLDLRINTWIRPTIPVLPALIPRVQPRRGFSARGSPFVAVPLNCTGPSGRVIPTTLMRDRLGADNATRLCIASFQRDDVIERTWTNRDLWVEGLKRTGYDLVTVPNYSLWRGDSFTQRRVNLCKSLRVYESLVDAGIPTMLHVSWLDPIDLHDWISELRRHPEIDAFSVDFQTLRTNSDWANVAIGGLSALLHALGPGMEVLVNGVSKPSRLAQLNEICGHLHVIDAHVFETAVRSVSGNDNPNLRTARFRKKVSEVRSRVASQGTMKCGLRRRRM